jgi:hypothetical protein
MYEHLSREGFPTVKKFREGILLGCIANALWLASGGESVGYVWEDGTYFDDSEQGEQWSVALTHEGAVAVFYSSESTRNPYPEGSPPYNLERYFRGMPDKLLAARERALAWMVDLDMTRMGGPNAVITSAMWADGERFTADEPWEVVFRESGRACHRQLLSLDAALLEWQQNFELDDEEVRVLRSLYETRVSSTEPMAAARSADQQAVLRLCESAGSDIAPVREVLRRLGIALD